MAEKADIWMPLYIGDYLADTMHLTTEQHGAYLLLLMAYWKNRAPLPSAPASLAAITKMTPDAWSIACAVLEPFFVVDDAEHVWRHERVEREMGEASERKEKQRVRAEKAAHARWAKNATSIPQALHEDMLDECPSPSPSPSPKDQKNKDTSAQQAEHVQSFERFWKFYPRKQGKQSALKSWLKIKPTDNLLNTIMAALTNQRASSDWLKDGGKFIPHASTWINQSRWEDEVRYVPEDTRGSASHLSLVDQVRQRNGIPAQRPAPPAGYGAQGSLVAVDGEVVGHDDQHVWP